MKGNELLKLIDEQRARVAKFADEDVSLILVVGPDIQIEAVGVGTQDKSVFQQHLVALLLARLDGVKLDATPTPPFITGQMRSR
jgi:hypothetical protein